MQTIKDMVAVLTWEVQVWRIHELLLHNTPAQSLVAYASLNS